MSLDGPRLTASPLVLLEALLLTGLSDEAVLDDPLGVSTGTWGESWATLSLSASSRPSDSDGCGELDPASALSASTLPKLLGLECSSAPGSSMALPSLPTSVGSVEDPTDNEVSVCTPPFLDWAGEYRSV